MVSAQELMQQAPMTAAVYMRAAVAELCHTLDISRGKPGWRDQLAPFAGVLAAMVAAAAADFDTAIRHQEHEERMDDAMVDRQERAEAA
jgi:hypothetical protein